MSDFLDLKLIGKRRYVRATDIMRAMEHFTGTEGAVYEFLRPLRFSAELTDINNPRAVVRIQNQYGVSVGLKPTHIRAKISSKAANKWNGTFCIRIGRFYLMASPKSLPALDLIEASFDSVHPKLTQRFVVRRVQRFAHARQRHRVLWFYLRTNESSASFTMCARNGPLAMINCMLTTK